MSEETVAVDTYPQCALCVGFTLTPDNILQHARDHGFTTEDGDVN